MPLLQVLCIVYACVCSLSRLTDHRHHWWDVLAGAVMGVLTVLYTVSIYFVEITRPNNSLSESPPFEFSYYALCDNFLKRPFLDLKTSAFTKWWKTELSLLEQSVKEIGQIQD